MNYYLYKLRFNTPVHLGDGETARSLDRGGSSLCADTLFSALCHMAVLCYGQEGVDKLCQQVMESRLFLTDLFPYKGEYLYIPKPYLSSRVQKEIPSDARKAMKKLAHIPLEAVSQFVSSIGGQGDFDAKEVDTDFGEPGVCARVGIMGMQEPEPYHVGFYEFHPRAGLYGVIGYEQMNDLEKIKDLLRKLGLTGIGGKVSSGYGKFILEEGKKEETEFQQLKQMLDVEGEDIYYISMTTALPRQEELESTLEGATYQMKRRGGFVSSVDFARTNQKKDTQYFFSSGSVFRRKFEGELYEVARGGNHKVYRYGKPLFLGVRI